jgi:hypothetical protein
MKGKANKECLAFSASQPGTIYNVHRSDISQAISAIENGTQCICVHSDIGNGKTNFIDDLIIELASRQFGIFRLVDNYAFIDEEISDILSTSGNKAFIIEDLFANRRTVERIRSRLDADTYIITTIRTSAFELRNSDVTDTLGPDHFSRDLNHLSRTEINDFVELFDRYSLWGEISGETNLKKTEHLRRHCRGQVRDIILDRFKKSYIHDRLFNHFSKENLSQDEFSLISSAFMLSVLGVSIKYSMLGDAILIDPSKYGKLAKSEKLREFISLDAGDLLIARSSIMADYVLRNIFDHGRLLDITIEMCRRMSPSYRTSPDIRIALQRICRFSHLRGIFDGEKGRLAISTFYDRTRELSCFSREPQFWLQYAISRAEQHDYDRAMDLLDGAESVSSKEYDTFKIDNTRARLLLDRNLETNLYDPLEDLYAAGEIIRSQIDRDKFDEYPYRVARKYARYCRHYANLGRTDVVEMAKQESRIVVARIGMLDDRSAKRFSVVDCKNDLEGIISL